MANSHSLSLSSASSQYVYRNASGDLNFTGNITLEIQAKFSSLPSSGNRMALIGKWEPGQNQYYFFVENNGGTYELHLAIANSGGADNLSKNITITTGTWYHFAVTFTASSSRYEFFKDGVSLGTSTGTRTSIQTTTSNMKIGSADGGNYFNGSLDEARLWSVVRTSTQISVNIDNEISATTGLAGYYKFNNSYADSSGNSLTVTDSGGSTFSTDVPFTAGTTTTTTSTSTSSSTTTSSTTSSTSSSSSTSTSTSTSTSSSSTSTSSSSTTTAAPNPEIVASTGYFYPSGGDIVWE